MAEREFEVRPIGVEYVCDVCNEGVMQPNGKMITEGDINSDGWGPKWPYKCPLCGNVANLDVSYPFVKHVRV